MLLIVPSFAEDILWPEFTQLAEALVAHLEEAPERIIREEVFRDIEVPEGR